MLQRILLTFGIVMLPTLTGCGSAKPEMAKVAGRIALDGAPVKIGTIMFYPVAGRPAVGAIQADGTYQLTTSAKGDGAIVGKHVVTIEATEIVGGENPKRFEDESKGLRPGELRVIVPSEYGDRLTSGLQADVQAKDNSINFDLKKTKAK